MEIFLLYETGDINYYKQIKNYNDVLFGITGDIFLLCLKDNIQINKFDCF